MRTPSIKVRPNHRPSDQQILIWAQQKKDAGGGTFTEQLDFSDARNSQYVGQVV